MAHWEIVSHPLWDCQWRPGGLLATCWRTIRVLPGGLSAIHWELLVLDASLSATHWRMSVASLRLSVGGRLAATRWRIVSGHLLGECQCPSWGLSVTRWRTVSASLRGCQPVTGGLSVAL